MPGQSLWMTRVSISLEIVQSKEFLILCFTYTHIVDYVKFKDLTTKQKIAHVFKVFGKIVGVLLTLYLFICSLSLMSSAFQILGEGTRCLLLEMKCARH